MFSRVSLIFAVGFFAAGRAMALDMPVGIPEPEFGIMETVEGTYGSNDYFTHYVDPNHSAATDDQNVNGTRERPRKTIPAELSPGNVVLIAAGNIETDKNRFYIRARGSADEPIFVRGLSPEEKPRFQKKIHVVYASWLVLENIAVDSNKGGIEIRPLNENEPTHHVAIRNSEIVGLGPTFKGGQSYSANSNFDSSPITDVVFYKNTSNSPGDYSNPEEDDTSSFSIQHRVRRAWVLENTGFRSGGDGVILGHGANFTTGHIFIGKNHFFNHRENGIDVKEANDVVISENVLHGFEATSSSSGAAIVIHYDPARIWILNNEVFDANLGIVSTGSKDTYVIGNVIRDIVKAESEGWNPRSGYASGAAIHFRGGSSASIQNNTVVRADVGLQLSGGQTEYSVLNNAFVNRNEIDGFDIYVAYTKIADVTIAESNFFDDFQVSWLGEYKSSLEMFEATGQCGSCLESSTVQFHDAAGNDFQLLTSSIMVDTGADGRPFELLRQLYGARYDRDISQNPRVVGTSIDIGAMELGAGIFPMPPSLVPVAD